MDNLEKYTFIENKIIEVRKNNYDSLIELNNLFAPLLKSLSKKINCFDAYEDLKSKLNEIFILIPIEETSKNHTTLSYISKAMKRYSWKYINNMRLNKQLIYQLTTYYKNDLSLNKKLLNVNDIIELLPPYEKEIFKLKYIDGLTLKEIGLLKNKSTQSIFKTTKKIKDYLNNPKVRNELLI